MAKKASVASVVPRCSPYFNQEKSFNFEQMVQKVLPAGSSQAKSSDPAEAPSKPKHQSWMLRGPRARLLVTTTQQLLNRLRAV